MVAFITRPALLAVAIVAATAIAGCYVEAEGAPAAYAEGYEPAYYDGYVVYYDHVGRPFYYVDGAVVWISPAARAYPPLIGHWHRYGSAYPRWYAHYGYRYRGYRGHHR